MPWFRNHYVCVACEGHWISEHAEIIEADCLFCRAYDVVPYKSDDWSAKDTGDLAVAVESLKRVVRQAKRERSKPEPARRLRRAG